MRSQRSGTEEGWQQIKPGERKRDSMFMTKFQRRGTLMKTICKRPHPDGWPSATFRGFDVSQVFSKAWKGEAPETLCLSL